ncbi:hypothetical protein Hypma_015863 [Hypsizygus marmoreus]|uniref:Uncharacterized protein n=1 Tax=Hypsizygus marmoreus TaxID=39966 RepID=A0A369K3Y6_HYPMA|nr:hypothetical protein Hypma_015863 [Hypsizygus marmoreus]
MWRYLLLLLFAQALPTVRPHPLIAGLDAPLPTLDTPIPLPDIPPRDLADLLDGDLLNPPPPPPPPPPAHTPLGGLLLPPGDTGPGTTPPPKPPTPTPSTPTTRAHSIIGNPTYTTPTPNPTAFLTFSATTSLPAPSSPSTTSTSTSTSPGGAINATPPMPPAEAAEWKVIGLVVICITFVGTAILSVVFFDAWWGFVCALFCGRGKRRWKRGGGAWGGKGVGEEDLVPDWEKRSWEYRLASEEGHRYPTLASMDNVGGGAGKETPKGGFGGSAGAGTGGEIKTPQMVYSPPGYDPHPLEPLMRRPSTNPRSPRNINIP